MDKVQRAAAAILAARANNPPLFIVCTDCTDVVVEAKCQQAQREHPLQEIQVFRVIHE